jgi:hypothetical protein
MHFGCEVFCSQIANFNMNTFSTSPANSDGGLVLSRVIDGKLPIIHEELEEGSLLVEICRGLKVLDDYALTLVAGLVRLDKMLDAAPSDTTTKIVVVEAETKEFLYNSFSDALSFCA